MRTLFDIHNNFARNLAYEDKILWDAYDKAQFDLFKRKLKELFKDPVEGGAQRKTMEKVREAVYKSTINQSKYTNGNLLSTFILVTVENCSSSNETENANNFSIHLLVRTRKCINDDDSSNCCMVFIDEQGNVYKNWTHFKETNVLPEGIALAPKNGVYRFENNELLLGQWMTPASSASVKVANVADVAAGVGGFAAAGGTLAALAIPAIVPALPVLGAVCLATGVYSSARSAFSLFKRKDHEQSIGLDDSSARGAWLGVASGALSVTSSIATKTLANLAMAGKEVSTARQLIVNGMNISTMLLSGTGVANGILDLILKNADDEEITALDVLQIAASLVIFTHSAYNFRLASTIVAQSQDTKINSYRSELSNRQRKMFDKMAKETLRTSGTTRGKTDLIRLVNEVPDKQFLNDLHKINKNLNENGVRFSAGQNGQILLNDEIQVNSGVLRNSVQHNIGENILGKVTQPIPDAHSTISSQETFNFTNNYATTENAIPFANYLHTSLGIISQLVTNNETFQDCLQNIIAKVGEIVAKRLIEKTIDFITLYGEIIEGFIKTSLPMEKVLWDLYVMCKRRFVSFTIETIEREIKMVFEELFKYYESLSFEHPTLTKIRCEFCNGFYQICPI